jgi:hypothetical protein
MHGGSEFFGLFVDGKANPGGAFDVVLLLWPMVVTWGYSMGVVLQGRKQKTKLAEVMNGRSE